MRRIFISFFLSILLLKYASSTDSECMSTADLPAGAKTECGQLTAQENYLCEDANGKNGEKPCIEVKTCNLLTPDPEGTDEDKCAGLTKLKAGNICKTIKDNDNNDICHEFTACEGTTFTDPVTYENCKNLGVDDTNNKCVVDDEEKGCKVAAKCDDVKKGANADVCSLFTTDNSKCVVDDEEKGCKVAAECGEVLKGANANVCGLFTTDKSKCVVADNGNGCEPKTICGQETYVKGTTNCRDSVPDDNKVCADTGNNCESQTPCGEVTYQEGTDCTKLPTVDPDKICRKHQTQQKCEEVTKPDNEEETGNKASEETGTNPGTKASEETGTNPSEETGTNPGTRPSGETSPTQGTETDLSKDNKGMLLNLSLYTLLIYFLF